MPGPSDSSVVSGGYFVSGQPVLSASAPMEPVQKVFCVVIAATLQTKFRCGTAGGLAGSSTGGVCSEDSSTGYCACDLFITLVRFCLFLELRIGKTNLCAEDAEDSAY
jgi:hypothetical protein